MQDKNTQKQAFWFTIINYVGIVIGVISTVFIYPQDKAFLGIVRYVDAWAQILFPVMVFGASQALIHFYPTVSEPNKKQLFKYGLVTISGIGLGLLLLLLLGNFVDFDENYQYVFYAFPIAVCLAFVELFRRQATNMQKLAMPTFFEKIIPKIALPTIFILLLSGYLNVINGLLAFVGAYIVLFVFVAVYVLRFFKIDLDFNFKPLFSQLPKKEYYAYSFFAFLGSFGSFFAFRLDALMIPEFLSFEANGTYNIGVTLASSIAIPATGLFAIYAPIVSKLIKGNEWDELGLKYVETAMLLFFVGGLLYGCVLLGIDSFFQLLPTYENLRDSIPVIYILGLNVLLNMGTGFNSEIISYSQHYKFNIYSVLVLVVLNVGLNLFVLTQTDWGILGVAYASLTAMTLFNIFKLYFIYKKFKILPVNANYLKLVGILLIILGLIYSIPSWGNPILNLTFKVGLFLTVTLFAVYKLKLIFSLNYWVDKLFKLNNGKQ